ncbi:extracellular solute-binding protein [Paenibacillus hemerocallicola]|jgi:multiple sugar transport system substrate-binding protein|uniref:Extracellular solute-binding protein n=2 Tax=Paenibacillus hemerocallicola TaxID=1172614 RepID=A0A5C4TGH3_9BACL|nr:extracellular solute-binding protein [Paenibacillus hemerocallicola]
MIMFKKSALALLSGSLLIAAACSNGSGQQEPGKAAKPEEKEAVAKKEPVELVFYDGVSDYTEERFMREIGEPIKKKFPHVTPRFSPFTKLTQVQDLISAGQPPDIIFASSGLFNDVINKYNMQTDITPLIQKYKYDLGKIDPVSVDMMKEMSKGGMYALPTLMSPSPIYYNKDIFDKFGVPYPKDNMTWDDLYELSKKVTRKDGSVQYYGFMVSFQHLMVRNQFSLNMVDPATDTTSFADEKWNKMTANVARFFELPGVEPTQQKLSAGTMRDMFTKDKTLAMLLPVSTLYTEKELGGMNWDMAAFPEFKELPGVGPQPYPISFYMTATNKHRDVSFEVIAFLASEEYQLPMVKQGQFPTALASETLRNSFGQDTAMYKGKNVKAMLPAKYAKASAFTKFNNLARNQLQYALEANVLQKKDVNTALREAAERANAAIKAEKAK